MPYDQIVKGVLTATSREGKTPEDWVKQVERDRRGRRTRASKTDYADRETLDLFWRRQQHVPIEQWGEKTAAAFLGVRLECAQCHKHPFDRWTQADYRAYANIFAPGRPSASRPEAKKVVDARPTPSCARSDAGQEQQPAAASSARCSSAAARPSRCRTPTPTGRCRPRRWAGRRSPSRRARTRAARCSSGCATPDNPFFARSFVNRVWGHYFGVGIVHPVDDFSLANPPSNEKLLDALAKDFVESKYDIRHIEQTVLMSRTYQLSQHAQRDQPARQEQLRPQLRPAA